MTFTTIRLGVVKCRGKDSGYTRRIVPVSWYKSLNYVNIRHGTQPGRGSRPIGFRDSPPTRPTVVYSLGH